MSPACTIKPPSPVCFWIKCIFPDCCSFRNVFFFWEYLEIENILQPNSCCFPLCKPKWVPIYLIGPSQDGMGMFFACTAPNVCFSILATRNTPLTSPSTRLGMMNAFVSMAALKALFWMATWWACYGSQTPFLGILRGPKSIRSPCPTRWSASTRMARCCTQSGMSRLWSLASWDSSSPPENFCQRNMGRGFILNDTSKGPSSFPRPWAQSPHVLTHTLRPQNRKILLKTTHQVCSRAWTDI